MTSDNRRSIRFSYLYAFLFSLALGFLVVLGAASEPVRGLAGAMAGGGSANAAEVLPQHKTAVGRYFDRPAK